MNFPVGSLVHARGREWVVLPPEDDRCLRVRPLGGCEEETIGLLPGLEPIRPAVFELPDPRQLGDAWTCGLLRDAARLGFRATSGPLRSFGHIAVEPRPYQLVPLLMAMKQHPIRLLLADDVGIGKTVEAALIVRELLDRGEIRRLTVLCPPQLAEQWHKELESKFHIQAELVLPSTVRRLEKGLGVGVSLFDVYPATIVSLDYIKAERRRDEFLRACPEMVLVDEAHTCASAAGGRGSKQRYELVRALAANPQRHLILITATPHSGKDDVFRSLLGFLKPEFASLPDDLSGPENEQHRKALAEHFVQRRRGDVQAYMDTNTPFPQRESLEKTWKLNPETRSLFDRILTLAQDTVEQAQDQTAFTQRIHWWSALALLRAMASSPKAAAATLRCRAQGLDSPDNPELVEELGRQSIFDVMDWDGSESLDIVPGADSSEMATDHGQRERIKRRLRDLARDAEALCGPNDAKLQGIIPVVRKLLDEGFAPIIFCRFIPTAEYLVEHLRPALPKATIIAVTGLIPPEERKARVLEQTQHPQRILVCTDCLSEGVNLQEHFNAVVHYDLSWNPTRHEQREGRIDRFGQPSPWVRVVTYYGADNKIDGLVLEVLLRKHQAIRKALGVSVPIPEDSDTVLKAVLEGLLLRSDQGARMSSSRQRQLLLPGIEDYIHPEAQRFAQEWDKVAHRQEKRSRTLFAQHAIKVDEVARELAAANEAAGGAHDVESFMVTALQLLGATHERRLQHHGPDLHIFSCNGMSPRTRERLGLPSSLTAVFHLPAKDNQVYLSRTHPVVERVAAHILNTALDPLEPSVARRAGVMRTDAVSTRTTLLLCRFRLELKTTGPNLDHTALTEECALLAFTGAPTQAVWLEDHHARNLVAARPTGNITPDQAAHFVERVVANMESLWPHLHEVMAQRAQALVDAHRRIRTAAKAKGLRYTVTPQGQPDVLGLYVFLPNPAL